MGTIRTYLDGAEITPNNIGALEIELQFDKDNVENKGLVTVTNLELIREDLDTIEKYIQDNGVCQAPQLDITVTENLQTSKIFEGYLALNEDHEITTNERCTFKLIEKGNLDWFERVASSTSFEYLASIGVINSSDYKFIPYVLNSIPNYTQASIALITVYTLQAQLGDAIIKFSLLVVEMSNPFEATAIVRTILLIAEILVMIAAMVIVIIDFVKLLIQPVKYHAGMNIFTMLQKSCAHFGLTFKSSILEKTPFNKAVWIPEKFSLPNDKDDKRILGFLKPQPNEVTGYFKGTIADLFLILKTMFYAKIKIVGTEIHLVPENENITTPQFVLPDIYTPTFKYNSDEIKKTTVVTFKHDVTDKNTVQEWKGTNYQVTLQPKTIKSTQYNNLHGYQEFRINAALAKTKRELTTVEEMINVYTKAFGILVNAIVKVANVLIKLANKIIKTINKILKALKAVGIKISFELKPIPAMQPSTLGNQIENRKGMLKIEYDNFTEPKILLLQEGTEPKYNKIHPDNDTVLSAKFLWDNFINQCSPVPSAKNKFGNQCKIIPYNRIPFFLENYDQIKTNNKVYTFDSKEAKMVSGVYNTLDQVANFTVRIPYIYETNLIETYYEPTGV